MREVRGVGRGKREFLCACRADQRGDVGQYLSARGSRSKYVEGDGRREMEGGQWGWGSLLREVLPRRSEGLEGKVWDVDNASAIGGEGSGIRRQGEDARQVQRKGT